MTTVSSEPQIAPQLFALVPMPASIDELPPPDNGPYYVIAKDGVYIHRHTYHGRTLTPAKGIDHLPSIDNDYNAFFWYNEDNMRLPADLVGRVWSFFRSIYNKRHSEAMVNLTWHPEHGYRVFVPPQQASGGGVQSKFEAGHLDKGSRVVGTIHSHCDFGAFHSGIDTHDADSHDGLHMTIGHVDKNPPEIATMVSSSGKEWHFKTEDVLDGPLKLLAHPKWWERYVEDPAPMNNGKHVSKWSGKQSNGSTTALINPNQRSWLDYGDRPWYTGSGFGGDTDPKDHAGTTGKSLPRTLPVERTGANIWDYDIEDVIHTAEWSAGDKPIEKWTDDVEQANGELEAVADMFGALGIVLEYKFSLEDLPDADEEHK